MLPSVFSFAGQGSFSLRLDVICHILLDARKSRQVAETGRGHSRPTGDKIPAPVDWFGFIFDMVYHITCPYRKPMRVFMCFTSKDAIAIVHLTHTGSGAGE